MPLNIGGGHSIIRRHEWGAQYSDGYDAAPVPAQHVWLHHSVTIAPDLLPPFDDDDAAVRTLERIGEERFHAGISYTFAVTPVGRIYQGHTIGRAGAHTKGHNYDSRAIVLIGDYSTVHPSDAQINAIVALMHYGRIHGWWTTPVITGGHRDTGLSSTECPGNAGEASIPVINRRILNPQQEDDMAQIDNISEAAKTDFTDAFLFALNRATGHGGPSDKAGQEVRTRFAELIQEAVKAGVTEAMQSLPPNVPSR